MTRAWWTLLVRDVVAALPPVVLLVALTVESIGSGAPTWPGNGAADDVILWFLVGLFVGGRDERTGTAAFLDGLPITRRARALLRWCATQMLLASVVVLFGVAQAWHHIEAVAGAAEEPALAALAWSCLMTAVVNSAALSVGLLLAPAGVVGLLLPFLYLAARSLIHLSAPQLRALLLEDVLPLHAIGGRLWHARTGLLPWVALWFVATLGIGALSAPTSPRSDLRIRRWQRAAVVVGLVAWAIVLVREARSLPAPPVVVSSRHFEFTLPATAPIPDAARLAQFDADVDTMSLWFGIVPTQRLRADATGTLLGAHGLAQGKMIALHVSEDLPRRTVAHEASHVLATMVSNGTLGGELRTFSEGLAQHVARRVGATTTARSAMLKQLVPASRRGTLDTDHFIDADAARELGGPIIYYASGEALIDAMVELHGADAPFCVLRNVEGSVATGLTGRSLWNEVLGRCGMWLSPIVARAIERVDELGQRTQGEAGSAASTPLPGVHLRDGGVEVVAYDVAGAPWPAAQGTISCQIRQTDDHDSPIIERCSAASDELAGLWVEVRVRLGHSPWGPWLRVAVPER